MQVSRMHFSGKLLERGFWLYVWDIRETNQRRLYVGRTGDSSSCHASSPFRRIGQHLETKLNAKGNALGKQLKNAGINPNSCTFEMVGFGPIFEEEASMDRHRPRRDQTAALERALADELTKRGYVVLGTHGKKVAPDTAIFQEVVAAMDSLFPSLASVSAIRQ